MKKFDLIIVGGGPGGYETAFHAAQSGLSVALVEKHALGGTCLNEGCIPTKCLCHDAGLIDEIKASSDFNAEGLHFDYSKAQERKEQVMQSLRNGISDLLKSAHVTCFFGTARFTGSRTLRISLADAGTEELTAPNIILATGSVSKYLPIDGAHLLGVYTSSQMLNIDHIPQRLCIIGGGVIGMEFAAVFNSFGSKVQVVEFCKEILPPFDSDIAKRLRTTLKKSGIDFFTQAAVTAIRQKEDELVVAYSQKGQVKELEADIVLMAVGRGANLDAINLNDVGIEYTRRGVTVDENMQTNIPGIYAVGDINGLCQLAHAASFQGKIALAHILGEKNNVRLDIMPSAVFTNPEVAMVGKTESQCKELGIEFSVHKSFFRANGKALSMDAPEGLVKILVGMDDAILGCHIMGAHASDLVQEIVMAMNAGVKFSSIASIIHTHPTLSEVMLTAARS